MRQVIFALLLTLASSFAMAFDHTHAAWTRLLQQHVVLAPDEHASQLRYAALARERDALEAYLASLSAVTPAEYQGWRREQRLAFLINAYNAFTVELILTRYPRLESIKDLGSLLSSPWKKSFVPLLGKTRSLDEIEHGLIRERGVFDEPRIHVAVNCASIGCPLLAPEAFVAEPLDAQLELAMRRFLADRSRNRFDPAAGRLRVSKIFDWYGEDFTLGHQGIGSLKQLFARHAELLADAPADRERLRAGDYRLDFLDYDWRLNDAAH